MTHAKSSIAVQVTIVLVAVATVLLGALGLIGYHAEREQQLEKLHRELMATADQAASGLSLPVWNLDHVQIDKVIESLMKNDNVSAVVVKLPDTRGTLHARSRDENWKSVVVNDDVNSSGFLSEQRKILSNSGENIGTVKVLMTTTFVEASLRYALATIAITIFVVAVILIASLYVLLSRLVLKPLKEIETYAVAVSSGDKTRAAESEFRFHGELANLRASIEKMVAQLDARYTALQSSSQQLQEVIGAKEREVIERKAIEADLKKNQRDLQSLASRLLLLEERERKKFSQLLHDHIGQNLTYTRMKLELLRKRSSDSEVRESTAELLTLIDQMAQETRSLTYELSPPLLYEIGLDAALEWLCENFEKRYGLSCAFSGSDVPDRLNVDLRVALFQCARELLFNVIKHAQAKSASVRTAYDNGHVRLIITDDGIGLNHSSPETESGGFGLFSVRERMHHIGGEVEIDSAEPAGARVVLLLPLDRANGKA
jgi:signal transduction histidine kinase